MKPHTLYMRKYRAAHPEYVTKGRKQTIRWRRSSSGRAKRAAWYAANKEKIRAQTRIKMQQRRATPRGLLENRLRARIGMALRAKSGSTRTLIGCSWEVFKAHIEKQFVAGMSWANRSLWHVDHIKPVSKFDLTTLAGQQAAFHYSNCQPLWAPLNLAKGAR